MVTSSPGFEVTWDGNDGEFFGGPVPDNAALAINGSLPFSTTPTSVHAPTHVEAHLNDGNYGNAKSHINGPGSPEPTHMGIALPGLFQLEGIAFGRDNNGVQLDRTLGLYTLQITTVTNPNAGTPDGDWTTVGTVDYQNPTPLRHRYAIATDGGDPVSATGVRIILANAEIGIDELELYAVGVVPIARLFPVEDGGAIVAANNLAVGATAFAKDVLAGRAIGSLNDQTVGDASAWVGDTPDSFAGLRFGGLEAVRSIAFGRDNTGAQTNRSLGEYTLQITEVASPDETTPDEDWTTIATILYEAGEPADPHLRHRFNYFTTEMATGIRLLTPDGAAIDELEVYAEAWVLPSIMITPAAGFSASWDGNSGAHFGVPVPDNLALASNGGSAFASNDPSPHAPTHAVVKLNDGFYGNANSHINGGGPSPGHMGIALPELTALSGISWGRDNITRTQIDRSRGVYTLQFTAVEAPDATTPDEDWTTIAEFVYGPASVSLRHQYEIGTSGGGPIVATGVRLLLSEHRICIDEIELYGGAAPPPAGPKLDVTRDGTTGDLTLRWDSQDGRLYDVRSEADLSAPEPITWPIFGGNQDLVATPPENVLTFPLPAEATRFFVVEEFPAPPESVFSDDFESGEGGWTKGFDDPTGNTVWELGAPSSPGPSAANSPSICWGTNLSATYEFDAMTWLRSPAINLTNAAGATLCYHRFIDIEIAGAELFDWGEVSVLDVDDNDSVIDVIEADITGTSADWEKVTLVLPAAALGKMIKIEFRLESDDFMNQAGFYVDDVTVTVP